jgi:hypothetical protein
MALIAGDACAPARDTVMRDVERNYKGSGFLDTETFQVLCSVKNTNEASNPASSERLGACQRKLIEDLVAYKEQYDSEAFSRRLHLDFRAFLQPKPVSDDQRTSWRGFYEKISAGKTRLVYEEREGENITGAYRLRLKDLIYRVQAAE